MNTAIKITAFIEKYDFARPFAISRGVITSLNVIVVEASRNGRTGRGEAVPMGSRVLSAEQDRVAAQEALNLFHAVRPRVMARPSRDQLYDLLPAGAVRNAIDCALWDLEAKESGHSIWRLTGIARPDHLVTAYTLSLASPAEMAAQARDHSDKQLLKLKLGGEGDIERVTAVAKAAPRADIIVDANEAWSMAELEYFAPRFAEAGVRMIEQPLPAGRDHELAGYRPPLPLCADESCHVTDDLDEIADRYQMINIKLDKTGGLTEALRLARAAQERNLDLMVGCMVGTSLSMAPGMVIGALSRFVDLDGPLLLAGDHKDGITYRGSVMECPAARLWG